MYACTIILPSAFKNKISSKSLDLVFKASTVHDALTLLTERYTETKNLIFDGNGQIQRFVNIYIGEDNIKDGEGLETAIDQNTKILILSAVAGG